MAGQILFLCSPASANPSFVRTESGDIRIEENGSVYDIYSADRSIGAFNSFGNAAGETINSIQASPDNTVLFRVIGNEPSVFYGALNANSRVFLINHNGIVFGEGSQVNASGLVASTLDIANNDFLAGRYAFERNSLFAPGYILNQGDLVARNGGYIALLAGAVDNEGTIRADGGEAVLAAGDKMLFSLDGTGLVSVQIDGAIREAVYDLNGQKINDALANGGQILAGGGRVILSAKAAEEIFDNTINHSGVIEATSASDLSGEILLDGGDEGIVRVSGVLDASGKGEGETGGSVRVLGDKIGLTGSASIDVSGDAGGGEALVGGDAHGLGLPTASYVFAGSDTSIKADALTSGDGGKVVLWSEEATRAYGSISARGGASSGDGGFVETSGGYLEVTNPADVAAPHGAAGTWLLDPENIEITDAGGGAPSNVTQTGAGDPGPILFAPTAINTATLVDVATINAALDAGSNVVIDTNGSGTTTTGTITVNRAILKSADGGSANGSTLTLTANDQIVVNDSITSSSGLLNVTFTATNGVTINDDITTNGGAFNSTGIGFTLANAATITTGGGNATINHTGAMSLQGVLTTGAGTAALTASSIALDTGSVLSTSGAVTLTSAGAVTALQTTDAAAEINTGGNVTISALSIGTTTNHLEIAGDSSANSTLALTSTAASAQTSFVDVLTDEFSAVSLVLADAEVSLDLDLFGADSVTIAGTAAINTINATLTGTQPNLTYSLSESQTVAVGNIQAGAANVNLSSALGMNVGVIGTTGSVTLSALAGPIADNNAAAVNITATSLTATGNTGVDLDTTVTNLTLSTTGPGNITVDETDGANVLNAEAADADGAVTITTATGNLAVSTVTATTVTLGATTGAITDGNAAAVNISATSLTATAATGIDLDMALESVTATTTGAGAIVLDEATGVTLTNVQTANGAITIRTGGNTTATRVVSVTDADANDISITASAGDLSVGNVNAGTVAGDLILEATVGDILKASGDPNLVGDQISLTADGDIGSPSASISYSANNLNFNITGVGTAYLVSFTGGILDTSLSSGSLVFATSGDITIRSADAFTGSVQLTAGGSIFAEDPTVVVTAFGDIRLNAGGTIGTVTQPLAVRSLSGGTLYLSAAGQSGGLSAHLVGNIRRENVDLGVSLPPGLVLYNNFLIGGVVTDDVMQSVVSSAPEGLLFSDAGYANDIPSYGFSPAAFDGSSPAGRTLIQADLPDFQLEPDLIQL